MKHPDYLDIIKYLEKEEVIEKESLGDHLEELLLNDFVHTLLEKYPNLDKDELVLNVYSCINKVKSKFVYFNSCALSEGYDHALLEIKDTNEEVYLQLIEKFNND